MMFLAAVMHADRYRKRLHPLAIKARGGTEQQGRKRERVTVCKEENRRESGEK
jgi:hypothetical protein